MVCYDDTARMVGFGDRGFTFAGVAGSKERYDVARIVVGTYRS